MLVPGQPTAFSGTCTNLHAICWVNPNAFTAPTQLGAGNAPINNIIGPNFSAVDLSLRKAIILPFREGMRLQFQADAFNALNHANWNNPGVGNAPSPGSASTSTFGQITSAGPARVLQFGGKFVF